MTNAGGLGVDGKGKAPHWRLTELEAPGGRSGETMMLPTKNYLKWNGTKFRDDKGAVKRAAQWKRRRRTKAAWSAPTITEADLNSPNSDDQQVIRLLSTLEHRRKCWKLSRRHGDGTTQEENETMAHLKWRHSPTNSTAHASRGSGGGKYLIYKDGQGYTVNFRRTPLDEGLSYVDAMRLAEDHNNWRLSGDIDAVNKRIWTMGLNLKYQITPEQLFAFYEQELESVGTQLKEKYGKQYLQVLHRLPKIFEMIEAKRNQKVMLQFLRMGIRNGIWGHVRSCTNVIEESERKAKEKARKAAMSPEERKREREERRRNTFFINLSGTP
jgi:hypothetical protein